MGDEDKIDLFARGAAAAAEFLETFNWTKYKSIRKGIADAFLASYTNNGAPLKLSGNSDRLVALSSH
jgi:hypothetical protein